MVLFCWFILLSACAGFNSVSPWQARTTPGLQHCQSANDTGSAADRAGCWFRLGNDFAETGCFEQAENAYREALKHGPHAKALHNLGLVQVRLGVTAIREARAQLSAADAGNAGDAGPAFAATEQLLRLLLYSVYQNR